MSSCRTQCVRRDSPCVSRSRSGSCGGLYVRVADLEETGLDEEVPHTTSLVHVDLHEVARFAPPQLAPTPRVLAHERLLDDEVRFG